MTVGLDIDDTMTNSKELIMVYAKNYFKTADEELVNKILHAPKIEGKLYDFYKANLPEMISNYQLKPNVKKVINRLRKKGHKIVIITTRGYTHIDGVVEATVEYFKKHKLITDKMIFKTRDKAKICLENNINLMIDDYLPILDELEQAGVNCLMYSDVANLATNKKQVNNWLELEKYINSFDLVG